jgi:hypothetical protein
MSAEVWASIGTVVATLLFVVVPGVVYAWYVLDGWIGEGGSYPET